MIRLEDATLSYPAPGCPEQLALTSVNLEVLAGQVVLLTGPSGSGKTSLLNLVAGLRRPTRGRVMVDGFEVSRLPDERAASFRRERIGFVFQALYLIPGQRVLEAVTSPMLPGASAWKDLRRRALALLDELELASRRDERIERLSTGEQQRVAIARALMADPPVVLADEPSAALDEALTESFAGQVAAWKRAGKTVLLATHDPALLAMPAADRTVALRHGRLA